MSHHRTISSSEAADRLAIRELIEAYARRLYVDWVDERPLHKRAEKPGVRERGAPPSGSFTGYMPGVQPRHDPPEHHAEWRADRQQVAAGPSGQEGCKRHAERETAERTHPHDETALSTGSDQRSDDGTGHNEDRNQRSLRDQVETLVAHSVP